MVKSSVLVKKSMLQQPSKSPAATGRISSRISPFRGDDGQLQESAESAPQHHHFFSGNFDVRVSQRELPMAQLEDDDDSDNNASQSFATMGTRPMQPSSPYAVAGKLRVDGGTRLSSVTPAKGKKQVLESLAPLDALRKKTSLSFDDVRRDPVAVDPSSSAGDDADRHSSANVNNSSMKPELHVNTPSTDPAPADDDATATMPKEEEAEHEEEKTKLLSPQPHAPSNDATQYASNDAFCNSNNNNDLDNMVKKFRSTTVSQQPQHNIHAELLLLKGSYLFHPQEPFLVSWQFVVGIAILYSIIVVPLRLGFSYDAVGGWNLFELSIDCFFVLDIVFNFRTAFFNEEKLLIYDARVICKKYAKSWFVPDLISTIPFDSVVRYR